MKAHKYDGHNEDTRIALLEQSIGHINETLIRFEKRFDKIDGKFDKIDDTIWKNFFWTLAAFVATITSLLAVMARGFHWY